jgi:hypothetical protein
MSGEMILRGLALVLIIPVIGGTVGYLIGHPLKAMVWNGVVPLLVFVASALAFLNNPTQITCRRAALFYVSSCGAACVRGRTTSSTSAPGAVLVHVGRQRRDPGFSLLSLLLLQDLLTPA